MLIHRAIVAFSPQRVEKICSRRSLSPQEGEPFECKCPINYGVGRSVMDKFRRASATYLRKINATKRAQGAHNAARRQLWLRRAITRPVSQVRGENAERDYKPRVCRTAFVRHLFESDASRRLRACCHSFIHVHSFSPRQRLFSDMFVALGIFQPIATMSCGSAIS